MMGSCGRGIEGDTIACHTLNELLCGLMIYARRGDFVSGVDPGTDVGGELFGAAMGGPLRRFWW
jgi:hypothetical protein